MGRSGRNLKSISSRVTITRARAQAKNPEEVVSEIKKIAQDLKKRGLVKDANRAIHLLEEERLSDRLEGESKVLDLIEKLVEEELNSDEAKNIAAPYLQQAREDLLKKVSSDDLESLSDVEIIRLARWQTTLDELLKEESLNSANAYSLLVDANGSDEDSWLSERIKTKKQLGGLEDVVDKENISFQTHLAEAVLALSKDPEIAELDEAIREREEEIRDEASVLGIRPSFEDLVVVPHSGWLSKSDHDDAVAHHCESEAKDFGISNEYILIYASRIKDSSGDKENGTNYSKGDAIGNARHELIHAAQLIQFGSDKRFREKAREIGISSRSKQDDAAIEIREALTESLNIIRGHKSVEDSFSKRAIDGVDCSYRDNLNALAGVLDRAQVPYEERALLIETFNSSQPGEIVDSFDNLLKKAGEEEGFLSIFPRLMDESRKAGR